MFVALLVGCGPLHGDERIAEMSAFPLSAADMSSTPLAAFFTDPGTAPGEERDTPLDDALIDLIEQTETSLDLALYDFDQPEVIAAVRDSFARGVDVRVVGDADEADSEGMQALSEDGTPMVMRRAGDRIMHHKFLIADQAVVWTGSTNLTRTGMSKNNNNAIILPSVEVAAAFTDEFEQMFVDGLFGTQKGWGDGPVHTDIGDTPVTTWFAPQHDPIDGVVKLIDEASLSVHFTLFSFTHDDVVDALLRAQDRGISVLGVMDTGQAAAPWSADEDLVAGGIPVVLDGNRNSIGFSGGKLHHKSMIIDGLDPNLSTVLTGSANWSNSADRYNDENLVALQSGRLGIRYLKEFCRVWRAGDTHPDWSDETVPACPLRRSSRIPPTHPPTSMSGD